MLAKRFTSDITLKAFFFLMGSYASFIMSLRASTGSASNI